MKDCDFCGRILDGGEELTPIFIGEPPSPKGITAKGIAPKRRETVGYSSGEFDELMGTRSQLLGLPVDELEALVKAITTSEHFEYSSARAVQECPPKMVVPTTDGKPDSFDSEIDDSKVSATVKASLPEDMYEPDMMVCEYCEESLQS